MRVEHNNLIEGQREVKGTVPMTAPQKSGPVIAILLKKQLILCGGTDDPGQRR
jgi:hypothetical protein